MHTSFRKLRRIERHSWRSWLLLAAGLAAAGAAVAAPTFKAVAAGPITPSQTEPTRQLVPGQRVESLLIGGEIHAYSILLPAGQFMQVRVESPGNLPKVVLLGPEGTQLAQADEITLRKGWGRISWFSDRSATYRLEVSRDVAPYMRPAPQTSYGLQLLPFRESRWTDGEIVAGERALANGPPEEAVRHFRAAGDPEGLAESLQQIGGLEQSLEALALWRSIGYQLGEITATNDVADIYLAKGEWQQAYDYAHRSLAASRNFGRNIPGARALWILGQLYEQLGDPEMAVEYYSQGVQLLQDQGQNLARHRQALMLEAIANLQIRLGHMDQALQALQRNVDTYQDMGNRNMEAYAHVSMASAYVGSGQFAQAMAQLDRAMELYVGDKHQGGQIRTLIGVGKAHLAQRDAGKAQEVFGKALQLSREYGTDWGDGAELAPQVRTGMAEALLLAGDRQGALAYYREALALYQRNRAWRGEAEVLRRIAEIESALGSGLEARRDLESSLGIIESFRGRITGPASRSSFTASNRRFYESYLDLLMREHAGAPSRRFDALALETSERARMKSFVEMLAEARVDIRKGVDPVLLEREHALARQIDAKGQSLISAAGSKGRAASVGEIEKEFDALLRKYQELESEIRAKSPRYAELNRPQPISLREIQKLLDPQTLLLEYWLGEKAGYLWVVGRDNLASHVLPERSQVEEAARRFYDLINARQPVAGETPVERQARVRSAAASYRESAAALSRMLLGPAMSQLGTKRLLIVADGALHYVSFASLPVSGPSCASLGGDCLLIHEHEIVYLPSVSVLAALRGRKAGQDKALEAVAVFADPVFEKEDPRVRPRPGDSAPRGSSRASATEKEASPTARSFERTLRDVGMGTGLPRLMASRQEARAILAADPSRRSLLSLDFDANRARVLDAQLKDYDILHFATHGVINNRHPELSGLVLSLVDPDGTPQAGFLGLNEIYNLQLRADLVVLSACNTALGKNISGEGLVGLTRGFMYAGAQRVAASLWKVDDEAAAEEMGRLYRGLMNKGLTAAAALRAAQLQMLQLRRWQSPYYWAAFILQGDW